MRPPRSCTSAMMLVASMIATTVHGRALAQGRGQPPGPPPSGKAGALIDLTGYWVSIVSEDWRYRMVTPAAGDYQGVPMTADAVKVADAWDPAADEPAGLQCKSYGAAAIMRVPGRIHVTWPDDETLRVDTDAGTQTRLFRFGAAPSKSAEPSWQGDSVARWEEPAGRGRGGNPTPGAPPPVRTGSLKVVTTNLRAGYLRKNGVPYSENAVVTEYFDLAPQRNGDQIIVVTTVVEDAKYLRQPFIVSTQFKKQPDARGFEPTPCSSRW